MPILFAAASIASALLLFFVQPMFARMALPLLGGSPAVWTTCILFFQATLLAGYAYAHALPSRLGVRRQALLHAGVLLLPLLVLPIGIAPGSQPAGDAAPVLWLLGLMAVSLGLPFFAVSTSAPLLQTRKRPSMLVRPVVAGALAAAAILVRPQLSVRLPALVTLAPAMFVCFSMAGQPVRLASGIAPMLPASLFQQLDAGQLLYAERTFFGVYRVVVDRTGRFHSLYHGTTLHGRQSLDPATRMEPLT